LNEEECDGSGKLMKSLESANLKRVCCIRKSEQEIDQEMKPSNNRKSEGRRWNELKSRDLTMGKEQKTMTIHGKVSEKTANVVHIKLMIDWLTFS
jgi:hypothetical protein